MQPLWIAVIVVFGTITGPLILSTLNNRQRRKEKIEDYIRQDLVAAKVTQAAEQAAEAAKLLQESNIKVASQVAETTAITNTKLDQIHTLVNSNMTAAMQSELDALTGQHALMLEVLSLKEASGGRITEVSKIAKEVVEHRMIDLRNILQDRLHSI